MSRFRTKCLTLALFLTVASVATAQRPIRGMAGLGMSSTHSTFNAMFLNPLYAADSTFAIFTGANIAGGTAGEDQKRAGVYLRSGFTHLDLPVAVQYEEFIAGYLLGVCSYETNNFDGAGMNIVNSTATVEMDHGAFGGIATKYVAFCVSYTDIRGWGGIALIRF